MLTNKQKRFCQEYVIDLNGTQAAIRAGYSDRTANRIASENLSKLDIKEYIKELQEDIQERNKITIDECVSLLASMARVDIRDLYNDDGSLKNLNDIPKESRLVIEGIDTDEMRVEGSLVGYTRKLKISNRRANIIELMKYLGGYKKDNNRDINITIDDIDLSNASAKDLETIARITGIKK